MGSARKVMDQLTEVLFSGDLDLAEKLYAPDAIGETADGQQLKGGHEIVDFVRQMLAAFPDGRYEPIAKVDSDTIAVDEGRFTGTNTAPLIGPTGEKIPATGRRVSMRSCDVIEVDHGLVTRHRFYFDQFDMLNQLGLLPRS
jgi:predicted ester cyclase